VIQDRAVKYPPNVAVEVQANAPIPFAATDLRSATTTLSGPTHAWDYGDGATATGATPPDHSWPNPGYYRMRLTITDGTHVEVYDRVVRVGLNAGSIGTLATFASFEPIVLARLDSPTGTPILVLVPLLAAGHPYDYAVTGSPHVVPEPGDLAALSRRLLQVYANRALMLPMPEADVLPEGLYLLFPREVVYAGINPAIADFLTNVKDAWTQHDRGRSLYEMRPWDIAKQARNLDLAQRAMPTDLQDPSNGYGWLAPGLSGLHLYEQTDQQAVEDTDLASTSLYQGQDLLAPRRFTAREQALQWLAIVGGSLAAEVRKFGEERGPVAEQGETPDYPAAMFAWNTADATLACSVIGESPDPGTRVQNYWLHGAMTFGLTGHEADRRIPDLDALSRVTTALDRRILDDAATRQILGEDRPLGAHVVEVDGRKLTVCMRSGEVFAGGQRITSGVETGAHVVASLWAGLCEKAFSVTDTPPLLRMPALAEARTRGAPGMNQTLLGRRESPSVGTSEFTLDTANAVTVYPVARGGEVRVANRSHVQAMTAVLGPYAIAQLERVSSETEPFRDPMRKVVSGSGGGKGGCGGSCGGK
jgi:hypothetical protein